MNDWLDVFVHVIGVGWKKYKTDLMIGLENMNWDT